MSHTRPLSPPSSSNGELLRNGFRHLIQHNSTTSFPHDTFQYDENTHLHLTPQSSFSSPVPAYQDNTYQYAGQQPVYTYHNQQLGAGLGVSYEGYSNPYPQAPRYNSRQRDQKVYQYDTPAGSPPTPSMPTPGGDAIRTRSRLAVNKTLSPPVNNKTRIAKLPKPKKIRKEKVKAEKKIAKLEKPLSELTKSWSHVPVVDIEAYVNRPADERRKEVAEGKVPGRIKRPMNSFMLYRKAYQNRTKNWCLQNNHQVVSQVCGDSWPLEPEEIREQFNEWARIERVNHQSAHPGYKFSPSKAGVKISKRKLSEDNESEESDLEDFDWQGGNNRTHNKRRQKAAKIDDDASYQPAGNSYRHSRESSIEPVHGSLNRSSYHASNPGQPLPSQYSESNLQYGHYYQQIVQNNSIIPGVEDVIIRTTVRPGESYPQQQEPVNYSISNQYPPLVDSIGIEYKIDPTLIAQDNALYDESYFGHDGLYAGNALGHAPQWQTAYDYENHEDIFGYMSPTANNETLQMHDQHTQMLKGNQEGWQIETLDAGQEFDKWMDGE